MRALSIAILIFLTSLVGRGYSEILVTPLLSSPWKNDHTTQAEPVIAVTKEGIVVVFVDTQHFLPHEFGVSTMLGHAVSVDRGKTFYYLGPVLPNALCTGSTNPSLAVSPAGTIYLASLQDCIYGSTIGIARSFDGGKSFSSPALVPQPRGQATFPDLPQVVVAPDSEHVFVVWTDLLKRGVFVSSSQDGEVFTSPRPVVEGGAPKQFARLAAAPEKLYCFWLEPDPKGIHGFRSLRILGSCSHDHGMTWSSPQDLASVVLPFSQYGMGHLWNGVKALPIPNVIFDPVSGLIFLVVHSAVPAESDVVRIMLLRLNPDLQVISTSFVDDNFGFADRFHPAIAVCPSGEIGIAFYVSPRSHEQELVDVWLLRSFDGGRTFESTRITQTSFKWPPIVGQPTKTGHYDSLRREGYVGDYISVAADDEFFYVAWTGSRNIVYTPSYPDGRLDLDIFFANVPARKHDH